MSTRSAESRDNSPDDEPEKRASKKRKVLSCYACRNRKMKCDRVYPVCGRCQKTGRADQCTYDPRLLEELPLNGAGHEEGGAASFALPENAGVSNSTSVPVQPDPINWKIRSQERRIEALENKLVKEHSIRDLPPSHYDNFDARVDEPAFKEERMFRGKAFKTQFYGSTAPFSILTQFLQLQSFTREAFMTDGAIVRIRADFKSFRDKRKALNKDKRARREVAEEDIFNLVPPKVVMDAKVSQYFQTFETCYRILHEPSFWRDYYSFWERKSGERPSTSFATILVLISALTKCTTPNDGNLFIGDSSVDREEAADLIEACDLWLMRHSRKHLTVEFFQMQCLSLLAKRANCLKIKQDWVNSGDLMRTALAAGLHRNPSLVSGGRITEFEKEMRRRLWVTIMELELQSSIDRGLQSSLCGLYWDSQTPSNIPDESLSVDCGQIPASRPVEHFTPTAYLAVAVRSLPLRIHLMQLLNNPSSNLRYEDVLHYDAQINSLLASLPTWDDTRAFLANGLLDFQLRQFLLILHQPYASLTSTNSRFMYSFTACVDAASSILSLYDNSHIGKGNYILNHLRNDILRIGMTLAHVVFKNCPYVLSNHNDPSPVVATNDTASSNCPNQCPKTATKSPQDRQLKIPQLPVNNFLLTTMCKTSITLMEKSRAFFEHKVMRLGTGYMEFWLLSAAIGNMPSTSSSDLPGTSIISVTSPAMDDLNSRVRKALDRITSLCFRIIALQKDPGGSFANSLRSTMAATSESDGRTPLSYSVLPGLYTSNANPDPSVSFIPGPGALSTALEQGKGIGSGTFDSLQDMQVDLAGWTFPDFWADIGADF
ncbi:C6 zinc finger domain-containing protein [Corynespora cassiicola Philippines]|uniref:C6 zinc finger domain-containing protein n=1 Tax=Corynespora cassiicola Philippines TaxID=1448308 RepID=A0A2T2N4H4_CORCC|nr:C6 zinc finger domain-containing protein [Corynespora cassiicola Philippines]